MATKKQTTAKDSSTVTNDEILSNGTASANGKTPKTTTKKSVAAKVTDAIKEVTAPVTEAVAPVKKKAAPKTGAAKTTVAADETAVTKVFGEIQVAGNSFFIHKGSVPEGQLQLVVDAGQQGLLSRIPGYNGQFVTIIGKLLKKKKTDKVASFALMNIASHDQIGHRAYELSHQNPTAVEDNWFKAENELLSV